MFEKDYSDHLNSMQTIPVLYRCSICGNLFDEEGNEAMPISDANVLDRNCQKCMIETITEIFENEKPLRTDLKFRELISNLVNKYYDELKLVKRNKEKTTELFELISEIIKP